MTTGDKFSLTEGFLKCTWHCAEPFIGINSFNPAYKPMK